MISAKPSTVFTINALIPPAQLEIEGRMYPLRAAELKDTLATPYHCFTKKLFEKEQRYDAPVKDPIDGDYITVPHDALVTIEDPNKVSHKKIQGEYTETGEYKITFTDIASSGFYIVNEYSQDNKITKQQLFYKIKLQKTSKTVESHESYITQDSFKYSTWNEGDEGVLIAESHPLSNNITRTGDQRCTTFFAASEAIDLLYRNSEELEKQTYTPLNSPESSNHSLLTYVSITDEGNATTALTAEQTFTQENSSPSITKDSFQTFKNIYTALFKNKSRFSPSKNYLELISSTVEESQIRAINERSQKSPQLRTGIAVSLTAQFSPEKVVIFEAVYKALLVADAGPWKNNFLSNFTEEMTPEEKYIAIQINIINNPKSRSAVAWGIIEDYFKKSNEQTAADIPTSQKNTSSTTTPEQQKLIALIKPHIRNRNYLSCFYRTTQEKSEEVTKIISTTEIQSNLVAIDLVKISEAPTSTFTSAR